jgi:carbamoyl-phosphate synthase small subunit
VGEVVFCTGMSGYQESLTDPSYRGQILVMTFPTVGNYGTSAEFSQSESVHCRAVVVREHTMEPSDSYRGKDIDEFLRDNRVPGISGVDTRDLVIRIREHGTLKGAIIHDADTIEDTVSRLRGMPSPSCADLVSEVSCTGIHRFDEGKEYTVGLLDCGEKDRILRNLRDHFNVMMFPYDTPSDVIEDSGIQGILVSNGPGDPSHPNILKGPVRTVSDLSSVMPVMGICLGNQITALAFGGRTYKMKFGHRGCNQPVSYDGRIYITSQNHGFAVDGDSLDGTGLVADQFNINDGSVEGMRHRDLPIFTSQYHPEAHPGPDDTSFLFGRFLNVIRGEYR